MTIERETPDSMEYFFFGCMTKAIKIKVKAPNDAHIALTYHPVEGNPMYEIFIGGWGNSKVAFRKNREKPEVCELALPNTLSPNEYRDFWVTYYDQTLAFGIGENPTPVLVWNDAVLDSLPFVGIRTAWGSCGSWIVDDNWPGWKFQNNEIGWAAPPVAAYPAPPVAAYPAVPVPAYPAVPGGHPIWVGSSNGILPGDAIEGGFDNEKIYVGRAPHNGSLTPGKVVPSHGVCYIAWGGAEHAKDEYEVLTGCCPNWIETTRGEIPQNAIPGGTSETGETLFIGRAQHRDTLTIGKIQPSHQVCYISYGGEEIAKEVFDILVL